MQQQVAGVSGVTAAIVLALIYFFSMYGFSMLTGHIMAMAGAFFVVGKGRRQPAAAVGRAHFLLLHALRLPHQLLHRPGGDLLRPGLRLHATVVCRRLLRRPVPPRRLARRRPALLAHAGLVVIKNASLHDRLNRP